MQSPTAAWEGVEKQGSQCEKHEPGKEAWHGLTWGVDSAPIRCPRPRGEEFMFYSNNSENPLKA